MLIIICEVKHFILVNIDILILILIYLLTVIRLTPGGSSTVHIYTQTIHRTTHITIHRTTQLTTNWEGCGPCPVFVSKYMNYSGRIGLS